MKYILRETRFDSTSDIELPEGSIVLLAEWRPQERWSDGTISSPSGFYVRYLEKKGE